MLLDPARISCEEDEDSGANGRVLNAGANRKPTRDEDDAEDVEVEVVTGSAEGPCAFTSSFAADATLAGGG